MSKPLRPPADQLPRGARRVAPDPVCIAWRRLDCPGHDAAVLRAAEGGWLLEGAAAFLESGLPCHLGYCVAIDHHWQTRSAVVKGWHAGAQVDLEMGVDSGRRWSLNGKSAAAVAGAIDLDLAFTPATNLLPVRRLGLVVGGSASVVAAWLPFPALELRPLAQVYRRIAGDTYDYSASSGDFRAQLTVSPNGFVTNYPGLWVQED